MSGFGDVIGIDDVLKDLHRKERAVQKEIKKEIRNGTKHLLNKVREATQKDSGDLKKNTKAQVRGFDGRVIVNRDAWYWVVLEYGSQTRGLEPTYYSQKVIEVERPVAQQMIIDGVDRIFDGS